MPYTIVDFRRDFARDHLSLLTPAERVEGLTFVERFTTEERLKGLTNEERLRGLPVEDRLAGLSPEELRELIELIRRKLAESGYVQSNSEES